MRSWLSNHAIIFVFPLVSMLAGPSRRILVWIQLNAMDAGRTFVFSFLYISQKLPGMGWTGDDSIVQRNVKSSVHKLLMTPRR